MKLDKYIFSTFIAAAALTLGSCSDFLDRIRIPREIH